MNVTDHQHPHVDRSGVIATSGPAHPRDLDALLVGTWGRSVFLLVVAVGAYLQTWFEIWPYWENKNATYTHGILVALVTVWLVWRARPSVNQIAPTPSMPATLVLMMLSALWLLAAKANMFIVHALLWPPIAFTGLWAGLGAQVASRFAFPLSFLYFGIPIWDYLKPLLQEITFTTVGALTSLFGIPAALNGPYVTLPTGTIFIAEDCSGAHFLCVALAVGVLAGTFRRDNVQTRVLILIIAGLLSLAFNWLRVLLIILAYLHTDLREAFETIGHVTFGWWVFFIDLIIFALVLRIVPRSEINESEQAVQLNIEQTARRSDTRLSWYTAAIAMVVLPIIVWTLPRFDSYPNTQAIGVADQLSPDFSSVSPDLRWNPYFVGVQWEDRSAVTKGNGVAIEIYVNRYHDQTQGSELFAGATEIFNPRRFNQDASTVNFDRDTESGSISAVRETWIDEAGTVWRSYYTYVIDDEPIAGGRSAQLRTAFRSMYSKTAAGIVAAAAPCPEDYRSCQLDLEIVFLRILQRYREIVTD